MSAYITYDLIGEVTHPRKRPRRVLVEAKLQATPTREEATAKLREVYPSATYVGFEMRAALSGSMYPRQHSRRISPVRKAIA